ncbi:hypothetical protein [Desulfosporosinus sp. SB140]|uniref:hypothetical protein n=1 Tax=Desulfosporosinus paludis TaxID=3115649 RepID=UPI00388DB2A3
MMPSLPSSISLNFDETDSELWQVLHQIEPELRSAFIKEALRLMLQSHSIWERFLSRSGTEVSELGEEAPGNRENPAPMRSEQYEDELQPFSLEALFTEDQVPGLNERDSKLPKGYQYMMKNIIGLEDDEEVLKVLQGLPNQRAK